MFCTHTTQQEDGAIPEQHSVDNDAGLYTKHRGAHERQRASTVGGAQRQTNRRARCTHEHILTPPITDGQTRPNNASK